MRISHEAIYHAHVQGRGALRRELVACLRTGRALRIPRARTRGRGKQFVKSEIMISKRPAEAEDRAVPGHWEGDLIVGLELCDWDPRGTTTRSRCCCRYLAWMTMGSLEQERSRTGRARGRGRPRRHRVFDHHVAQAASPFTDVGPRRRDGSTRSTPNRHRSADYFCDPHSPWQRGTNENTNGLLRQYFPKGTAYPDTLVSGRCCRCSQQPPPQDPRLEAPAEALGVSLMLNQTTRCCDDTLNPRPTPGQPFVLRRFERIRKPRGGRSIYIADQIT